MYDVWCWCCWPTQGKKNLEGQRDRLQRNVESVMRFSAALVAIGLGANLLVRQQTISGEPTLMEVKSPCLFAQRECVDRRDISPLRDFNISM